MACIKVLSASDCEKRASLQKGIFTVWRLRYNLDNNCTLKKVQFCEKYDGKYLRYVTFVFINKMQVVHCNNTADCKICTKHHAK